MIYAIRSAGFVKIGYCARDPIRRLEKLQIGNPVRLKLIALLEGGPEVERHWHARWDHARVRGEWFRLTPELRAALEPHAVDHKEVSRSRPQLKVYGVDMRQIHAMLADEAEIARLKEMAE